MSIGNYALIENGVVINMIVGDSDTIFDIDFGEGITVAPIPDGEIVNQGYLYDTETGDFTAPDALQTSDGDQ